MVVLPIPAITEEWARPLVMIPIIGEVSLNEFIFITVHPNKQTEKNKREVFAYTPIRFVGFVNNIL